MSASPSHDKEIVVSPFSASPTHDDVPCSLSLLDASLALSARPSNELIMSPFSIEPSSPPFEATDDDDSMDDEIEIEADFSRGDNANKMSGNDLALWKGMKFASLEEFESFYQKFAISEGYTVRIRRTVKFPHTDRIRRRQYVCSCAGFCEPKKSNHILGLDQEKTSRRTSTRRSGCPVNISVLNKNGVWKVGCINMKHNHLLVSPASRIHLKQPGGMPYVAKNLVEKFSETDLPIGRVADIVNCDASINVSQRNCWNHRRDLRRKNLEEDMKNCLYNSITTEQFDNAWKKIMEDYKLTEDKWLNNLFDIRQKWIPVYNRTIFYAGMNTTQRCESIHSFFDSFLNKGTTLREFVIKYEHALEHRYRAEHVERFASIYKNPILKSKSPLEKEAADVYTRNMFKEFLEELTDGLTMRTDKLEKIGTSSKYKVSYFHNPNEAFVVTVDVEVWDASCECHLFEFKGILCRHILAIFNKKNVAKIPSKYILPRWTKKVGEGISIPILKKIGDKDSMVRDLQLNDMMSQLRSHMHMSTNAFDIIMDGLNGILKRVSILEQNQEGNEGAVIVGRVESGIELPSLNNPPITKTKGRKKQDANFSKNGRIKRGFEVTMENSKKAKRQCKNCGQYGHYSSTCERRKHDDAMEDAPTEES
ncbi:protein FAR1-RELATED SEQUENCE 1-like [Carex rostrata]